MTDTTCPVCGQEEHTEMKYWKGFTMCSECFEAMKNFENIKLDAIRRQFYANHWSDEE